MAPRGSKGCKIEARGLSVRSLMRSSLGAGKCPTPALGQGHPRMAPRRYIWRIPQRFRRCPYGWRQHSSRRFTKGGGEQRLQLVGEFQWVDSICVYGWGGRIRTSAWRYQKPLPYRLATPQRRCLASLGRSARDETIVKAARGYKTSPQDCAKAAHAAVAFVVRPNARDLLSARRSRRSQCVSRRPLAPCC